MLIITKKEEEEKVRNSSSIFSSTWRNFFLLSPSQESGSNGTWRHSLIFSTKLTHVTNGSICEHEGIRRSDRKESDRVAWFIDNGHVRMFARCRKLGINYSRERALALVPRILNYFRGTIRPFPAAATEFITRPLPRKTASRLFSTSPVINVQFIHAPGICDGRNSDRNERRE